MTDRNSSLGVRTDRRLVRAVHHSTRYALVEVTAPAAIETRTRPRVNVAFVLDRSGSMGGQKIELAKQAVIEGIERLAPDDRFSVVMYDNQIDLVAESRLASTEAKQRAIADLRPVGARGNTNLGGGWLRGAEQVALNQQDGTVNRVLLLTDGLANEGITDPAELIRHASELRARGIATSTFGVGEDFDEKLLGGMADAGGGAFRYIGKAEEIPGLIRSEVGELLEVTARSVELRISGPDGIRVEPLGSFSFDRVGRDGILHLGDLVADQAVTLAVKLEFPLGEPGREIGVEFAVRDQTGRLDASVTQAWEFASGDSNDRQPRERQVDRVVARTYADRALRDAVDLNRRGQWDEAKSLLRSVARRIRSYAGDDSILRGIVAELERQSEAWSVMRTEVDRKEVYAAAAYSLKSRNSLGEAPRRSR
jgi:Ca-activated chloride channel homolog